MTIKDPSKKTINDDNSKINLDDLLMSVVFIAEIRLKTTTGYTVTALALV